MANQIWMGTLEVGSPLEETKLMTSECSGFVFAEKHIQRILAKSARELAPGGRKALLACLQVCADWFQDALDSNLRGMDKEQARFASNVKDQLLTLAVSSERFELLRSFGFSHQLRKLGLEFGRVSDLHLGSEPVSGIEADMADAMSYRAHFRRRSPFEWIAGAYLPEICFLFFGEAEGAGYLSFAEAVLDVLAVKTTEGARYSRESISRARRSSGESGRRKSAPCANADLADPFDWLRHRSYMTVLGLPKHASLARARNLLLKGERAMPGRK